MLMLYANLSDGLVNSSLPTILVSCKCDNPDNTRQIDVESMESACLSCVEAVKFASNVPESARLCLSSMLRAIMSKRSGQYNVISSCYQSLLRDFYLWGNHVPPRLIIGITFHDLQSLGSGAFIISSFSPPALLPSSLSQDFRLV